MSDLKPPTLPSVTINLRFFAELREVAGVGSLALELPAESSRLSLIAALARKLPASDLAERLTAPNVRIAVDQVLVDELPKLKGGEEVAFLPPVTGG